MGHGHIPVENLLDHVLVQILMFQIFCNLAHKENVSGEVGKIQLKKKISFFFFSGELFGLEI